MAVDMKTTQLYPLQEHPALSTLATTQHDQIWEASMKFVSQKGLPIESSLEVYRQFLEYDPTHVEDLIEFLYSQGLWEQAAKKLLQVLNDENFQSRKGITQYYHWLSLCQLLSTHAKEVSGLQVEAIVRSGIQHYIHEVGLAWVSLADYHIKCGLFEKAINVFEEGLTSAVTVKDFSIVFEAYSQFEENILAAKLDYQSINIGIYNEQMGINKEPEVDPHQLKKLVWLNEGNDDDLRITRLENLIQRRPELMSSMQLWLYPHDVHEWHKRVMLFAGSPSKQVVIYTEAIGTVDATRAVGQLHTLWVAFAKLYESLADLVNARVVFEAAVMVNFKAEDDLASVWCEWAKMELRHKNVKNALNLMHCATTEPSTIVMNDGNEHVQQKLYKSLKLWSFYLAMEGSLGNLDSTRMISERMFDLGIITPQIVLDYAALLEEHKFFDDAFNVYEKGILMFEYPHVGMIWSTCLANFVDSNGGKRWERVRNLFERALKVVLEVDSKPLYLQYAKLEEAYGLASYALSVYERAAKVVPHQERLEIYNICFARARECFGFNKAQHIYENVPLDDDMAINESTIDKSRKRNLREVDTLEANERFKNK